MSVIRITTNFNIDVEFEAAPFYRRLISWMIDTVVVILYAIFYSKMLMAVQREAGDVLTWVLWLGMILPLLTYHLICEILMNGQSIGKRITRLKVVNENGGQPSIGQYVIRWLIRTSDFTVVIILLNVSSLATPNGADFIWKAGIPFGLLVLDVILVNSKNGQRLGDILAHTILISTSGKQSINDTVFLDVAESYVPSFPQVMQLSDKDINALKGILDTARKRRDDNLAELAAQKIKSHLKIDTTLPAYDFLQVLLQDYNYLSTN